MKLTNSNTADSNSTNDYNQYGEMALANAPTVSFSKAINKVPSQYLRFHRTQANVEKIISEIEFESNFPIFVGTRNNMVYLQVGVIGVENYAKKTESNQQQKIVYGRAWFIESFAPTSEVVQTACLAVKKAREHELREKLKLRLNKGKNIATPFNSHIDAVLMSDNPELFNQRSSSHHQSDSKNLNHNDFELYIRELFKELSLNSLTFNLISFHQHSFGQIILDISLSETTQESLFPDLVGKHFSVLCESDNPTMFLHELMAKLINLSDRYVDETFSFRDFKRFSYAVQPEAIARFSLDTRLFNHQDQHFWQQFEKMSYEVDSERVPVIKGYELGSKIKKMLSQFGDLDGYLPKIEIS